MSPPPHPFRSIDVYIEEDGTLGIAWVSSGPGYMEAVTVDDRAGAINMEPLEDYLDAHFGTGKDTPPPVPPLPWSHWSPRSVSRSWLERARLLGTSFPSSRSSHLAPSSFSYS